MKNILTGFLVAWTAVAANARNYDITAQRISTADGLPTNIVSQIWQSEDGYMWFSTRSGLCRWDGYSLTVDSVAREVESKATTRPEFRLRSSTWQRAGNGRLTRKDKDGSSQSWQLIPEDIVAYTHNEHFHVADVNGQTEAISTYGAGLFLYDKPTRTLTQLTKENSPGTIDDDYLTGLYVDRTGCIWLVEDYLGVKCLLLNQLQSQTHRLPGNIQDVNNIRCVALMDNGRLLVGNQTGEAYAYDRQAGHWEKFRSSGSRVYAALTDKEGGLWLGTRGEGLWHNGQQVKGLPSPHIYKIERGEQDGLWVAMLEGGVAHILPDGRTETFLQGKDCHDLTQDKQGRWWVAAEDALYRLSASKVTEVCKGYFVCLCQTKDGTIWAGSIGNGLAKCDGTSRVKWFTVKNGLGNNNIYSIVEDQQGCIWAGTEEGLSRLTPRRGDIHNYTLSDSRLSNVFNERAAVCMPDGRLVFGSHDGLIEVVPTRDVPVAAPPTAITGLAVNGIMGEERDRLPYTHNSLTFHFSNFQYALLQSVVYQYRLEGFDKDWTAPTKEHTAVYRQLQPGHYVFRVRSNNGQGAFGQEARFEITICQPWWNTWWAWCIYVLATLLVVTVVLIVLRKMMRLHQQIDVERRVSAFKMNFYERIQRELRNPVNVLQGAAENVQEYGTSKKTMQSLRRGSRRMLKLMDMIQQFHRLDEVEMQVKAERDALNEEAERRFQEIQQTIHAEEEDVREIAPPPINRQCVLIVEEDDDNRMHLTDTLLPFFKVVSCQKLSETEELIESKEPSIILLDVSADWEAGLELTRRIRGKRPDLPVVHLSPFGDDAHQLSSLRTGVADYIVKPFSGKVFIERMKRCLTQQTPRHERNRGADVVLTDKEDERFLFRFQTILSQHIADEDFSVERFAELMHLGRTQFYKRVKALTGQPPAELVRRGRLDYAADLLVRSRKTVEEVMTLAGFHSATYFYNSFRRQFGMSPNDYRRSGRRE